jgi:hypothetical protein
MTRRVVQYSTGNVGRHALRAIIERPDLELVGVHAAGPDKIGRDAAALCGLPGRTGVTATNDIDALIALRPECVVYRDSAAGGTAGDLPVSGGGHQRGGDVPGVAGGARSRR